MKKVKIFFLGIFLIIANVVNVFAITDNKIYTDTIYNTYEGTKDAKATISNLRFTDIENNHWAKEAITKAGALNMVKGYEKTYRPKAYVSNQEALAFVLRIVGLEEEAQKEAQTLKDSAASSNVLDIWAIGYLSLARKNNLITAEQYDQAITINQTALPKEAFKRDVPASREQVATWVIKAINMIREEPLKSDNQQSIYNYSDWKNASPEHIENLEIALDNGILKGDNNKKLNPKGTLTRAEMAQILSNLDSIYNEATGLTKKMGTVAGIKDNQTTQTGTGTLERNIYIRNADGKADIIKYTIEKSSSPQALEKDAVVFNNGSVTGLSGLREGSKIEYLVDDAKKIVKFVSVKDKTIDTAQANGKLSKVDFNTGLIQIKDKNDKLFNYYTVDGLIGNDKSGNFVYISGQKRKESDLPMGSMLQLELKNNIVSKITYVGEATLTKELRGIVIENNPQFSYITVLDNTGIEITKNYLPDEIEVEKQPYYQNGDDIGYLDQMFPNFNYDPRDTTIDQIEAGDIVFITTKKDDNKYIEKISASPNYFMKYGKINQITNNGAITKILLQAENGQTNWYDIPNGVFISKGGMPTSINNLVAGNWIKILVNEAILSPGETMESVKEIIIEESGHLIGDILKGQIGVINPIQKTISLQNSYTLGKSNWAEHQQVRQLSIANNDIMYYYDGKRVSIDYVEKYLKRANGEAYVALEKNYAGNVISKITFRTGRDEPLEPDTVINIDGVGGFTTAGRGFIKTDAGTIVRKNGNLVDASSISINDYAYVSLNGDGKAGVVDIYEKSVSNSIMIARGRVKQIEDSKYFIVKSMSLLNGNNWEYSPVERKFVIDERTLFITESGIKNINEFIGYTKDSSIDKAFTIVFDGDYATHIIDGDYATKLVSGKVYEAGNTIKVKDSKYMKSNNTWDSISIKDATMDIKTKQNTLIIKNNKVVSINEIKKDDKLRIFTDKIPDKITSGMTIDAKIIFVEN